MRESTSSSSPACHSSLPVCCWTGAPNWFEGSDAQDPIVSALDTVQEAVDQLRQFGAEEAAGGAQEALDRVAEEIRDGLDDKLTIQQAADATGYSADSLRRHVREGTIPNAGEKHAPRIRRRDLPRRPGHRVSRIVATEEGLPSRRRMARSVVESS